MEIIIIGLVVEVVENITSLEMVEMEELVEEDLEEIPQRKQLFQVEVAEAEAEVGHLIVVLLVPPE
jgi:hypothetical protein